MITQLDLHTFKCFKELHLPLAQLTLRTAVLSRLVYRQTCVVYRFI